MRIFYHLSHYISHRIAGEAYRDALRAAGYTVSTDPESIPQADVAILHENPLCYEGIFATSPALQHMRTIAYCVWENEQLCQPYAEALQAVREIWTPSSFSQKSIQKHFPHVAVVPHIVQRAKISAEDIAFAENKLAGAAPFRFFSIIDALNPRKNVTALLSAFARLQKEFPNKVTLVLKQYRVSLDYAELPGIITINDDLTANQMGALHVLSHAYVSAHHAEGWGLGLSEAMAYGKPVIATAYSGNMDFMDSTNSLPIPYSLEPVSDAMCKRIPLFTPKMLWATINQDALFQGMKEALFAKLPCELPRAAAQITKQFSPKAVGAIMHSLLQSHPPA